MSQGRGGAQARLLDSRVSECTPWLADHDSHTTTHTPWLTDQAPWSTHPDSHTMTHTLRLTHYDSHHDLYIITDTPGATARLLDWQSICGDGLEPPICIPCLIQCGTSLIHILPLTRWCGTGDGGRGGGRGVAAGSARRPIAHSAAFAGSSCWCCLQRRRCMSFLCCVVQGNISTQTYYMCADVA